MKKILFAIISAILVLSASACSVDTPVDETPSSPPATPSPVSFADYQKYEVENGAPKAKFDISYYYGPTSKQMLENDDFLKLIAECGFTSIPLTISRKQADELNDFNIRIEILNKMKEYGLTCSGLDIRSQYTNAKIEYIGYSKEDFEKWIEYAAESISDCDNVCEWWVQDEPNSSLFPTLGEITEAIREVDPNRKAFINIFPSFASQEQWGTNSYEEYVQKFIDEAKPYYLCFDHYPFLSGNNGYKGFFTNYEIIRKKALENNLPYQNIVLLTDWVGWDSITKEMLSWQVSHSLVYGAKRITYFTFYLEQNWIDQGNTNACVDYMGNIYPRYYQVQEINSWLLPLGTELFGKTSTAVFHVLSNEQLEEGCTEYTSYGKLGEVAGLGDFAIGFFDDDSFLISNKNYASENEENTIIFKELKSGTKLEYFDTVTATWQSAENSPNIDVPQNESSCYAVTIKHGACIYLRVAE